MDILNIPGWIKIPAKISIPALWIFSGLNLFLPAEFLIKLHVLEWRNEHEFWLGMLFLVMSCLIIVYLVWEILYGLKRIYNKLTRNYRMIERIGDLNNTEKGVLFYLYNEPNYTCRMNVNEPIVMGLIDRGYLYTGRQVATLKMDDSIALLCTLSPRVIKTLEYMEDKIDKKIEKLTRKKEKSKNKELVESKIAEYREMKDVLTQREG